jgi:hypothetical protein
MIRAARRGAARSTRAAKEVEARVAAERKIHLPVFSLISQSTEKRAGFILWQLRVCFLQINQTVYQISSVSMHKDARRAIDANREILRQIRGRSFTKEESISISSKEEEETRKTKRIDHRNLSSTPTTYLHINYVKF